MDMAKASVKPADVDRYEGLTLSELEKTISTLQDKQKSAPSAAVTQNLSAARCTLQQRQRQIKARVMEFEQANNHHLLFFNSTRGFVKLAGHSALFFAATIADRIHWRYSLKLDTDHYSTSEDGIISFRSLENITARLAEINVFPDKSISDQELHYFKLAKVYSDEQIDKLRDNAKQDIKRIMTIVMPASPVPSLYEAITQASQLIYYQFKHLSDNLARETIGEHLVMQTYDMTISYLRYARAKNQNELKDLQTIIELSRDIRFGIAYASKLQILHHREVCKILEYLVSIERIAAKVYLRDAKVSTTSPAVNRATATSKDSTVKSAAAATKTTTRATKTTKTTKPTNATTADENSTS